MINLHLPSAASWRATPTHCRSAARSHPDKPLLQAIKQLSRPYNRNVSSPDWLTMRIFTHGRTARFGHR